MYAEIYIQVYITDKIKISVKVHVKTNRIADVREIQNREVNISICRLNLNASYIFKHIRSSWNHLRRMIYIPRTA